MVAGNYKNLHTEEDHIYIQIAINPMGKEPKPKLSKFRQMLHHVQQM